MQKSIAQMAVGGVIGQLPVATPCFPARPLVIDDPYELLEHVSIHAAHGDHLITDHFRKFDKQYGPYRDRDLVISDIVRDGNACLVQTLYSIAGVRVGIAVFRVQTTIYEGTCHVGNH